MGVSGGFGLYYRYIFNMLQITQYFVEVFLDVFCKFILDVQTALSNPIESLPNPTFFFYLFYFNLPSWFVYICTSSMRNIYLNLEKMNESPVLDGYRNCTYPYLGKKCDQILGNELDPFFIILQIIMVRINCMERMVSQF